MATLEAPVLPPFLYRYSKTGDGRLDLEIRSIREGYVWCAPYTAMNDPMEGFYSPSTRFQKQSDFNDAAQRIYNVKQEVGICCLTDTHDNELMWTHYAENYKGICVGYRPRTLLGGLPEDVRIVRLGYGNSPPEVGASDGIDAERAVQKVLSHKKSSWVYEREWRIFGPLREVYYDGPCVAEIRLGSRISDENKDRIMRVFGDTEIRIYQMTVDGYDHKWKRLKSP